MQAPPTAEPATERRVSWGLALAVAYLAGIAVLDIVSDDVKLIGLFLLAPLALSAFETPRRVAPVAAAAVLLTLAGGVWDHFFATVDHLVRVAVVTGGSALGLVAARARTQKDAARDELGATRERLDRTLSVLAEAVTVTDARGRTIYANAAAARLLGLGSVSRVLEALPGELARRFEIRHEDGSPVALEEFPGQRLLRGETGEPLLTRSIVRETGQGYWLLTKATLATDADGSVLAVNIIEDVTESKDAELRERFLNRAGETLASSLNHEETLQSVAQLAVPRLADWCAVELVEPDGSSRQVAVAHVDPEKVRLAERLRERYPPDMAATSGLHAVLRTGEPELYRHISAELLEEGARDEDHLRLLRELSIRSLMIVPMRTPERVIGAITFVAAETVGAYDEDALGFAQEVARRAAIAVENARLYSERAEIANTLQRKLLPSQLPEVDGWEAAALYRPGDRTSEVGGDFYDLFRVRDGLMAVLGDVTGKGIAAAAVTSLARHTAKTAAVLGMPPALILRLLDDVLADEPELSLLTAVCAHFTEREGRVTMTVASGGHPLPLLLREGEGPLALGRSGTLLGAPLDSSWPETQHQLQAGDTVLFYTDGVTDLPGAEGRFGTEGLTRLLASAPREPQPLIDEIAARLGAFQHGAVIDDTALLALQWRGAAVRLVES